MALIVINAATGIPQEKRERRQTTASDDNVFQFSVFTHTTELAATGVDRLSRG